MFTQKDKNTTRWRSSEIIVPSWYHSLVNLLRQVRQGQSYLFFGRFRTFRKVWGFLEGQRQRFIPAYDREPLGSNSHTIFQGVSAEDVIHALRQEGIYLNLTLPDHLVEQISDFAVTSPCTRWGFDDGVEERFLIEEVQNGSLKDGRLLTLADVDEADSCSVIRRIARDPFILDIVRRYVGYCPNRIHCRLYWSVPISAASDAGRFLPKTSNYHYDVGGFSALYAYFHISDSDKRSGAHVVLRRSHRKKPLLTLLFSSRYWSDTSVHDYYGKDNELVVEQTAGFGFLEDPACFHKALVPTTSRRLMLQIRYH